MHGTRDRVLELVLAQRGARVEDLAEVLDITPAAVRRHLDNLRADGMVESRPVKQATGRPYYAYYPTESAAGTIPAPYADLMARMLRSVSAQESVVMSVAEALVDRHRDEVHMEAGVGPEERVQQVTVSLKGEGILRAWHAEADGLHLTNDACPYIRAAEISTLPCESDRKAIELLLGLDVEQLNRIVDGSPMCEYLVRHTGANSLVEAQGVS